MSKSPNPQITTDIVYDLIVGKRDKYHVKGTTYVALKDGEFAIGFTYKYGQSVALVEYTEFDGKTIDIDVEGITNDINRRLAEKFED